MSLWNRLLGRPELPDGFTGHLDPDELVLAAAPTTDGPPVVLTHLGLWLADRDGAHRRVGWHLISKASWRPDVLTVIEASEREVVEGAVLLADRAPRRIRLVEPGRVPQTVHERVERSIKGRHHRTLPGGGAWFVQRTVPGRDGLLLQVRPDLGTDEDALRQVTATVAVSLRDAP